MIAYDKKSSHLSLSNQELGGFGVFFASLWFHAKIQPGDIGKAWRKEGARIDSGAISTLMYNVASQKCPKRNSSKTANNQQATQAGSLLFQQNQPLAFAKCSDVTNWDSDTFEFADSTSTMCHFQPSEDWVADGRCPSKLVTLKFILNIVYIYIYICVSFELEATYNWEHKHPTCHASHIIYHLCDVPRVGGVLQWSAKMMRRFTFKRVDWFVGVNCQIWWSYKKWK